MHMVSYTLKPTGGAVQLSGRSKDAAASAEAAWTLAAARLEQALPENPSAMHARTPEALAPARLLHWARLVLALLPKALRTPRRAASLAAKPAIPICCAAKERRAAECERRTRRALRRCDPRACVCVAPRNTSPPPNTSAGPVWAPFS